MVGGDCANNGIDIGLIGHFTPIYRDKPVIVAAQQQMMKSTRKPQRHGVLKRQARPTSDAPSAQRIAVHERNLRFNNSRCDGCVVPSAMFRLEFYARDNPTVVHYPMSEFFCHIALSSRAPYSAAIVTSAIIFAIPKGRILEEALPLMQSAGIVPEPAFFDENSRALLFATNNPQMSIIRVRAFDVATFVAHGAAQIGIVGSDVIDEFDYSELYAPVDLGIGRCRISVAMPSGASEGDNGGHIRVATKYPGTTSRYYHARGIQAECVKLNGAMELAPSLGLSGRIVDLVSSGKTLAENGLVETDVISQVSARLIVNRAAYKMMSGTIPALVERFRELAK